MTAARRRVMLLSLATLATAALLAIGGAAPGHAALTVAPSAEDGFGDKDNSYSWSMAWFRGELYIGTARSFLCLERATLAFYYPDTDQYPGAQEPDNSCPADKYDLRLRAEIWRFTPRTGRWKRVYRSPVVANPRAPGKMVARYIGFRGMAVYRGRDGKPQLYVGSVTPGEYIPELATSDPPAILRSSDGRSFEPAPGSPESIETVFGKQVPVGYRAMVVHDGRLFVSASAGLAGDGVVLEVKRPWSRRPVYEQISPSTMRVFELASFAGQLYAGAGDTTHGYSVWRTRARGDNPRFVPVVTGGAGRGAEMTSVVAMQPYKGRLYVGSSGWYTTLFPASELIRIDRHDEWDLVVGNSRIVDDGVKHPLSGLPDGFGNIFNAHFWREAVHRGVLYVGTNDWSWNLRHVPLLGDLLKDQFGFDVYGSCDGMYWWPATIDAFGKGLYNFGARTMSSTPAGGFIGSANHAKGTVVWRARGASPCGAPERSPEGRASVRVSAAAHRSPSRLLTAPERCGTVLSWAGSTGDARYRILRAEYRQGQAVGLVGPRRVPGTFVPDTPPTAPVAPATGSGPGTWVQTAFTAIGTTSDTTFVDRGARSDGRYAYQVVGPSGRSNLALVPSARPDATFADLDTALRRWRREHPGLARTLRTAKMSWAGKNRASAVAALRRLRRSTGAGPDSVLSDVLDRLTRRLTVMERAC